MSLILLFFSLGLYLTTSSAEKIPMYLSDTVPWSDSLGVSYNLSLPNLPDPKHVVQKLIDLHIPRVRLINPDPSAIAAFAKTRINIYLSIDDNDLLVSFAKNKTSATEYLSSHVVPVLPSLNLSAISVGSGIFEFHKNLSGFVVPALSNMYNACREVGMKNVSVATVSSFHFISKPFPPSQAEVQPDLVEDMQKLLAFLDSTNSPFSVDVQPYTFYVSGKVKGLNIEFTTFKAETDEQKLQDPATMVMYDSLFEILVDCIVAFVSGFGYHALPISVVATGWPCADADLPGGGTARDYNQGLIHKANTMAGSPLRRMYPAPTVFLQGLFDQYYYDGPQNGSFAILNSTTLELRYPLSFVESAAGPAAAARILCFVLPLLVAWSRTS